MKVPTSSHDMADIFCHVIHCYTCAFLPNMSSLLFLKNYPSHHSCLLPLELVWKANCDDLQRNSFVCLLKWIIICHPNVLQLLVELVIHLQKHGVLSVFKIITTHRFVKIIATHRFVIVDLADFWHRQLEVHSEGLAFSWGENVNNLLSIQFVLEI